MARVLKSAVAVIVLLLEVGSLAVTITVYGVSGFKLVNDADNNAPEATVTELPTCLLLLSNTAAL